jgi:hypothetical protein
MPTFTIDPNLAGGDFYRTESLPEGQYNVYDATLFTTDSLVLKPGDAQVNMLPSQVDDAICPIFATTKGNRIRLRTSPGQAAEQGRIGSSFTADKTVGKATVLMNMAGSFSINAPSGGPPKVKVVSRYLIDGEVWTSVNNVFGALSATIDATVNIDGLGIITSGANQTGLVGGTLGLTPSMSPTGPGVSVGLTPSTQTVASGTQLMHKGFIGELPVGTQIPWAISMALRAENDRQAIFGVGCSAATAFMAHFWAEIALFAAGIDPLYSSGLFSFDTGTGLLGIAHPLAVLSAHETAQPIIIEVEGAPPAFGPSASLGERSNLMPEVEAIIDGDVFSDGDGLLGSIISYADISFLFDNGDGTFSFNDGRIEFLDPADLSTVRASADITNVVADGNAETFTGSITNFQFGTLNAQSSPLGAALEQSGGTIEFDPDIISDSEGFTVDATTSMPWSVTIRPS